MKRTATVALSAGLTFALAAGYVVCDCCDVLPGVLSFASSDLQSMTIDTYKPVSGQSFISSSRSDPVDSRSAARLLDDFAANSAVGSDWSAVIMSEEGQVAASREPGTKREPASVLKMITAAAAARGLDMSSTLKTQVCLDNSNSKDSVSHLVLKGGGDVLLSGGENDFSHVNGRAGLKTLAKNTAEALKKSGISKVTAGYDDSLFGTDRAPARLSESNEDRLYAMEQSSMAIDIGRNRSESGSLANPDGLAYVRRSASPATDAARKFFSLLSEEGIEVSGIVSEEKTASSSVVATAESAKLYEILDFTLKTSDNTLAEEFGRLLALKTNHSNSSQGAVEAVCDTLKNAGIDISDLEMSDCSGLSPGSRLTASILAQTEKMCLNRGAAAVAAVEGTAVSGLSGTALEHSIAEDAAGLIRLKTGTLPSVNSMTGFVSRKNGSNLIFAVIVNNPSDSNGAKNAIDAFVSKLPSL